MSKQNENLRIDEMLLGKLTDTLEITMPNDTRIDKSGIVITNITSVYLNRTAATDDKETLCVVIIEGRNETMKEDNEKFITILSEDDYDTLCADLNL